MSFWKRIMYKTAHFCGHCEKELSYRQVMYSLGRCPLCGYKSKSASSVVATKEKAFKIVKIPSGKWWIPDKRIREFLE